MYTKQKHLLYNYISIYKMLHYYIIANFAIIPACMNYICTYITNSLSSEKFEQNVSY